MATPDRSTSDRPAILMASVLGAVAILATVFFLPKVYCDSPSAQCEQASSTGAPAKFTVAWASAPAGSKDLPLTASGGTAKLDVTGLQRGFVVAFTACSDNADPRLQQQAARATITVSNGNTTFPPVTATCADQKGVTVGPFDHTDIAAASAPDLAAARADVWAKAHNSTVTYTVTVTVTRAATTPIGLPTDPTFSATLHLEATTWTASLSPAPVEVAK